MSKPSDAGSGDEAADKGPASSFYSVKVDAKVWFSTERTFVHWTNTVVLLMTFGVLLQSIQAPELQNLYTVIQKLDRQVAAAQVPTDASVPAHHKHVLVQERGNASAPLDSRVGWGRLDGANVEKAGWVFP